MNIHFETTKGEKDTKEWKIVSSCPLTVCRNLRKFWNPLKCASSLSEVQCVVIHGRAFGMMALKLWNFLLQRAPSAGIAKPAPLLTALFDIQDAA